MTAFDDLSLLCTFVCIVECGSISAGARRLKTAQQTLSRHLRLLEEHCDAALLRRDTHRMSLTQTGQRLLADAQTILAHAEAATQRLWEDQTNAERSPAFVSNHLSGTIHWHADGQQFFAEPSRGSLVSPANGGDLLPESLSP